MAKPSAKTAKRGRVESARTEGFCHGCDKLIKLDDKAIGRRYRYHAKCR